MKPSANKNCLAVDLCHVGNPEAPACGVDKDHLVPLPLAEQMCPRALAGRIGVIKEWISEGAQPARLAEDCATVAWLELESAIARPNNQNASEHADLSRHYADLAISRPYSRFRGVYSAALLNVYRQPLLERREQMQEEQNVDDIRKGLGAIYEVLQLTPVHVPQVQHILDAIDNNQPHLPCIDSEGERQGFAAKLTGMMLAARQGIFLYPASDREANGISAWVGLNHDSYKIIDGEKKLIKFRSKAKNLAESGARASKYDDSVIFVNMRAVINTTLVDLIQTDKRLHRSLLAAYNGGLGVAEVGELLAAESRGEEIGHIKQQFLDVLGNNLSGLLGEDGGVATRSETTETSAPSPKIFGEIDDWRILPNWIMWLHSDLKNKATPEQEKSAADAIESYLKAGDERPGVHKLRNYIARLRAVPEPKLTAQCVGMYIDLARHPETAPEHAIELIEAGQTLAQALTKKDWRLLTPEAIQAQHYAALQSCYGEKYKKALAGETPTMDDEARLYLQLLELGKDTLEPARRYQPPRGSQFEIALHILNTRLNVRSGRIVQSTWPALPREDDPRTFDRSNDPDGSRFRQFKLRGSTAWDLAVTRDAFLAQDADCRYIQAKTVSDGQKYVPNIITIVAKDDFLLSSVADIVNDALAEQTTTSAVERGQFRARLNNYEEIFLDKLGF